MTTRVMQSEPFPDPAAAEAGRTSSSDASRRDALLRALLAGAVALLVMLLPAQLAAARDEVVAVRGGGGSPDACGNRPCSIGDRAGSDGASRWRRMAELEIRRRDAC